MMPRMSSSRMIRYDSSSILISVPPYFEISTVSPFFTVHSTFLPLSSIFPVPRATTLPSCGFSFAVSGMMIPPFFTSFSSIGCTSTRSPSGLTLTAICFISSFWFLLGCAGDRFLQNAHRQIVFVTSSCPRQRLRIPHRQRRLRRVYQHLFRRRVVRQLPVWVADQLARQLRQTPACKARR